MRILRLILLTECNRSCEGCCNQDWDLEGLEQERDFTQYDQILITGGEPMLFPGQLRYTIEYIRKQTQAPIYVYTAKVDDINATADILRLVDGMTVTLHEQDDLIPVVVFDMMRHKEFKDKSMRLNVFKGVKAPALSRWQYKTDIEWIKDCPLPSNEVLRRW